MLLVKFIYANGDTEAHCCHGYIKTEEEGNICVVTTSITGEQLSSTQLSKDDELLLPHSCFVTLEAHTVDCIRGK